MALPERIVEKRPMGILAFLSVIIFVGVGLLIGGLYLYRTYLTKQKDVLSQSLNISRQSFEPATISELQLLDKKISVSKELLKNHFVLSPLLEAIGPMTLPSIQFTKFDYQSKDQEFFVQMSGIARDYSSIALQDKEFNTNKGRYFRNVVFSNLTLSDKTETKGYVTFDVSFSVDGAFLAYENNSPLQKNEPAVVPALPAQPNPTLPTSPSNTVNPSSLLPQYPNQ